MRTSGVVIIIYLKKIKKKEEKTDGKTIYTPIVMGKMLILLSSCSHLHLVMKRNINVNEVSYIHSQISPP